MKWLALFLLALSAPAPQSAHEIARTAADAFAQGRLEDVRAHFSQRMTDDMPLARLAAARSAFLSSIGHLQDIGEPTCTPVDDVHLCNVMLYFDQRDVRLSLAIDGDGRIASLSQAFHTGIFQIAGIPLWMDTLIWSALFVLLSWLPHHLFARMGWNLLFGVPTQPSFPTTPEAVAILQQYHRWNSWMAAVGVLLMVVLELAHHPLPEPTVVVMHSIGMLGVWVHVRRRVWPHRMPPASVRTASLSPIEPLPIWIWLVLALPALILAVVTCYLAAQWDSIPAFTPIHWGPDALPDRWETKTFKGVFGRLLLGWSISLVLYTFTALAVWGSRRNAMTTRVIGFMACISINAVSPIALGSLMQPGLGAVSPERSTLLVLTLLPLIGLLAMIAMLRAMRGLSTDPTPGECWRAGMFYVNPADPAWMVRSGAGFSPNFGHRWILVLTILLHAQATGAVIYALT